ncbi:hypothetical protein FRB98_001504 [Tulasnella sp. 332]|nr:hypothetical protein FRB98_001504 [Tulasnella sp. 332]
MASLAMRWLSSSTSTGNSSLAAASAPPTSSTSKPVQPNQPSASTSAASRTSELPGVICKMCGTSVPMDKLGEHDCESKPAATAAKEQPTRRPSGPAKRPSIGPSASRPSLGSPPSTSRRRSRSPPLPSQGPLPATPSRANSKGGPPQPIRSASGDTRQTLRPRPSLDQGLSSAPNSRRPSLASRGPSPSQRLPPTPELGEDSRGNPGPGYSDSSGRRPSHDSQQPPDQPSRVPSRNQAKSPGPGSHFPPRTTPSPGPFPSGQPPSRSTPSPGPPNRGPPPSSFNANGVPPPQMPQRSPSFGPPPPQGRGPSPAPVQQLTAPPAPEQIMSPSFHSGRPSLSNSETPFSVAANSPTPSLASAPTPQSAGGHSTPSMYIPDTKVGGEAGMAGVGRRGFAAVAQAALFTQHITPHSAGGWDGSRTPSPGVWGVGMQRTLSPGAMPIVDPRAPGPIGQGMGTYSPTGRAPSPGQQQMYRNPQGMGPGMNGPGPNQPMGARQPTDPAYWQPPLDSQLGRGPPPTGGRPSLDTPSSSSQGRRSPGPQVPLPSDGQRRPSGEGRRPSRDQNNGGPSQDAMRPSGERSQSGGRRPSEDVLPPNPSERRPSDGPNGIPSRGPSRQMSRKGSEDSTTNSLASRPSQHLARSASRNDDATSGSSRPRGTSDASSTYTSLSIDDTGRKPVNNRPGILASTSRKASMDASDDETTAPLSPTSPVNSVRLPFFEMLKAQVGIGGKLEKTPSVGSSRSGGTLTKKASQSSVSSSIHSRSGSGSASSVASVRRRLESSKQAPSMPSVKEKRESVDPDDNSDTELAYASFTDPEPLAVSTTITSISTAPLKLKGKGASNSIPFPPSPSPQPPKRKDSSTSSSSGRSASTAVTSSSSYSVAGAGAGADGAQDGPSSGMRVGVKIVAASEIGGDDHQHKEPEIPSTAPLGTRGELLATAGLNRPEDLDVPVSPVSTPSPTSTNFTNGIPSTSGGKKRQLRQCRKCLKMIPRGKWVYVDVGTPEAGVMCDWDWKDSYLPKCRRCDLPIEGHIISATDGQLTGKYHRACFSCVTCNKTFPDKTFYCHDGSPYCRHHYAEATGSLCANASCSQPIEGACALDNDGKKYHPEHFVCDWAPPSSASASDFPASRRIRCEERLEEYWEVGKGRYCSERHAMWAQEELFRIEEEERKRRGPGSAIVTASPNSKATKRRTLFVEQLVDKVAL